MQTALDDETALDDIYVRLVRESDGHVFTASKGSPNTRYYSSSTVKPIVGAAAAWAVKQGWLTWDSLLVDELSEWAAAATNEQRNIRLQHLVSFTSGITQAISPAQWASPSTAPDWETFVDNTVTEVLAAQATDTNVPGALHTYNTDQHDLAGAMLVRASGKADWATYLADFCAAEGVFPGLVIPNPGGLPSAGYGVNYTAEEYTDFLAAIFGETFLTPALCQDLYADATASNPTRTTVYTWLTDGGMTGEDWHFGRGLWLEQRNANWVGAEGSTRISTIGNAGQYCFRDATLGVIGAVSITFPATPDQFIEGLRFIRDIEALITTWSAE